MSAKLAVVGAVTAGLFAVGGVAFAVAFQPVPVREVRMIQPAAVVETVAPTVAPVVVPTTQAPVVAAPVPVASTQAPVRVAPKPKVVTVPKAVAPAVPDATIEPGETLRYGNGELVKRTASGGVIRLPNCHQFFGADGVPIPLPAGCP